MGRIQSSGRQYQLKALNETHREIARRLVLGEKPADIAQALSVSTELVSIVRGSTLARDYMHELERARDVAAVDIGQQLRALAPAALGVLAQAVGGTLDGLDRDLRVKAAESILDRAGYGKTARIDARISAHRIPVTGTEIAQIKQRALVYAREKGMLHPVTGLLEGGLPSQE